MSTSRYEHFATTGTLLSDQRRLRQHFVADFRRRCELSQTFRDQPGYLFLSSLIAKKFPLMTSSDHLPITYLLDHLSTRMAAPDSQLPCDHQLSKPSNPIYLTHSKANSSQQRFHSASPVPHSSISRVHSIHLDQPIPLTSTFLLMNTLTCVSRLSSAET